MKIGIIFGAMAPRIEDQLPPSMKIKRLDLIHLQRDADAVTRLYVRNVLSDSEAQNARRRIVKAIVRASRSPQ